MEESYVVDSNKTLANTFLWMFLGLLSTGIVAAITYYTGAIFEIAGAWVFITIAQIVIALVMGFLLNKLSSGVITFLFFLYSMLTGLTFSVIFAAFELTTIAYALLATAGLFGVLAYLGYKTDKDISKLGTILMVALIIGLVLTVINIFLGSELLDIALDWGILAIFAGLTAYDINKIKMMSENGIIDHEKIAVYGAFQLYLDFINMFLRILSIMGNRGAVIPLFL